MSTKNAISRTGLVVNPRKERRFRRTKQISLEANLAKCAIAKPVQYSLRPFGGLFNPYSRGCSILCNHPGPTEVKCVVKQVKEQFVEGKGPNAKDEQLQGRLVHCKDINCNMMNVGHIIDPDSVPEEYFHHYTGSDSRPLTPTPTVASNRTRVSANTGSYLLFQARRCLTPDPINSCARERKQLVLDLRRSHSQETLFWNASSELLVQTTNVESMATASKSIDKNQPAQVQPQKNMRLCELEARKRSAEKKAQQQKDAELRSTPTAIVCINDRGDVDEETDGMRRRGKKKKKGKLQSSNTFHMSQEPETQIATLGPDSPNASARPSLVPNANNNASNDITSNEDRLRKNQHLRSTFISEDALKILRRGLNVDIVENTFEKFMNKALKEALRTIPRDQIDMDSVALREFKEMVGIESVNNDKWLIMPRKFTRSSARFGLPVNTQNLAKLTPIDYLSQHIWISRHRKQLYRYVFNKYLCEAHEFPTENDDANDLDADGGETIRRYTPSDNSSKQISFCTHKECIISYDQFDTALFDVLGYCGPIEHISEKIKQIKEILLLNEVTHAVINFRCWCGIVAFAERYLNLLPFAEDPCDEVEIADFETLERKYTSVTVFEPLKRVLNLIKNNEDGWNQTNKR